MQTYDPNLGNVDGLFDTILSVVKKVGTVAGKAINVVRQGGSVVVQPPGMPPIIVDSRDPDALRKMQDALRMIGRSVSWQPGQRQPTMPEQVGAGVGSFIASPVGMVTIGAALLLLLNSRRR